MIARIKSWLAWRRFQAASRRAEAEVRLRHGRVNDVLRARQAVVHAALAGGRS